MQPFLIMDGIMAIEVLFLESHVVNQQAEALGFAVYFVTLRFWKKKDSHVSVELTFECCFELKLASKLLSRNKDFMS